MLAFLTDSVPSFVSSASAPDAPVQIALRALAQATLAVLCTA